MQRILPEFVQVCLCFGNISQATCEFAISIFFLIDNLDKKNSSIYLETFKCEVIC